MGYAIKDVPKDGNCALHAIIDQLQMRGTVEYNITNLRQKTVDYLSMTGIPDGFLEIEQYKDSTDYISKQMKSGTWCDEIFLRGVSTVIGQPITIISDIGYSTTLHPHIYPPHSEIIESPLCVGLMTDYHYVSLEPSVTVEPNSKQSEMTSESTEPRPIEALCNESNPGHTEQQAKANMQLPRCVSLESWKAWLKSREWLIADKGNVLCKVCTEVYKSGFSTMKASIGPKIKLNFIHGVTTDHLNKSKSDQRKKLLKKIDKHAMSETHQACIEITQQAIKGELESAV